MSLGACVVCGEPASAKRAGYQLPVCSRRACTKHLQQQGLGPRDSDGMIRSNVSGVDSEGHRARGAGPWSWRPYGPIDPEHAEPGAVTREDGSTWGRPPPPVHCKGAAPDARAGKPRPTPADVRQRLLARGLSERQAEVLSLRVTGYARKEIAGMIGVSVATVDEYVARAQDRLAALADEDAQP